MNRSPSSAGFHLLYRRLSVGRAFVCASAFGSPGPSVLLGGCGLKTRDTADWKVCATRFMVARRGRESWRLSANLRMNSGRNMKRRASKSFMVCPEFTSACGSWSQCARRLTFTCLLRPVCARAGAGGTGIGLAGLGRALRRHPDSFSRRHGGQRDSLRPHRRRFGPAVHRRNGHVWTWTDRL